MKWNLSPSAGRLWMKWLLPLVSLILSPLIGLATDSIYINTGTIYGTPPQVDATNFYNSGTWSISTAGPYKTANTLNYTNISSMVGSVGWEFDHGPLPIGGRGWSANFVNNNVNANIQAMDGVIYNPPSSPYGYLASYLIISATNIVNKGTLQAGANGQLVLNGSMINLARSQVTISSPSQGGGYISGTNFALDTGLYPETWAQTNTLMNIVSL